MIRQYMQLPLFRFPLLFESSSLFLATPNLSSFIFDSASNSITNIISSYRKWSSGDGGCHFLDWLFELLCGLEMATSNGPCIRQVAKAIILVHLQTHPVSSFIILCRKLGKAILYLDSCAIQVMQSEIYMRHYRLADLELL